MIEFFIGLTIGLFFGAILFAIIVFGNEDK